MPTRWAEQLLQTRPNVSAAGANTAHHRTASLSLLRSSYSFSTSTFHHGISVQADTCSPSVATLTLCRESLDFGCPNPYTRCHNAALAWSLVSIFSGPAHHFHYAASEFHRGSR